MKVLAFVFALFGTFAGCTSAQLEAADPVTYVPGITCPDAHGVPRPLIAGYECCADHGLGAGACPEGTSCMNTEDCSGPLPPNDPFGRRVVERRYGL